MITLTFLQYFWYCIIYVALFAFAALDGFDLGVGILHPAGRSDKERRLFLNAIGPLWDGNAVWLIIVSGGLFAGFPIAFGTVFSSFYILTVVLICGLIFRAVAIEFRSKRDSLIWRATWDHLFAIASIVIGACVGFILAGLVAGIPIEKGGVFQGSFSSFFNFFTYLFAVSVLALFVMHGALFLMLKTEKETRSYMRKWALLSIAFFILCFSLLTMAAWFVEPHLVVIFKKYPWLTVLPGLDAVTVIAILYHTYKDHAGYAFIGSIINILFLFSICALGSFPNIVRSTLSDHYSITIFNASSSQKTLVVLLIIVAIGVPFVLAYSFWLYKIFKGKVRLDSHSY
jgi:cytochrome d ubiquinol oxidase subunit II